MALNIKNERTVALIRELAAATGQNMTSAIEEAIGARLAQLKDAQSADEADRASRLAEIHRLVNEIQANMTDSQREALTTAQADLYDQQGLYR